MSQQGAAGHLGATSTQRPCGKIQGQWRQPPQAPSNVPKCSNCGGAHPDVRTCPKQVAGAFLQEKLQKGKRTHLKMTFYENLCDILSKNL